MIAQTGCLKIQVVLLQTAQSWVNAGVCGGLCACDVGSACSIQTSKLATLILIKCYTGGGGWHVGTVAVMPQCNV